MFILIFIAKPIIVSYVSHTLANKRFFGPNSQQTNKNRDTYIIENVHYQQNQQQRKIQIKFHN